MFNNDDELTWSKLIDELKESDEKLQQKGQATYQSRKIKEKNHYKLIAEFDYIQPRRKQKGKKDGSK